MIATTLSHTEAQSRLAAAQTEILGLAVRRLALFGSVRAIAGMRGRSVHDHFGVHLDIVWDVATIMKPIVSPRPM
jgi:uncharacterized protein with HEPN domain